MDDWDFAALRADFPMLLKKIHGKPLVYLDSAATAQKPQEVIDAVVNVYQNNYGTVHRAIYQLAAESTAAYEAVRRQVQAFINSSDPSEIIFTRGTTDGINLVAHSFGKAFIRPGDEVIISEMEHHSNIVPWQLLCQSSGARLRIIPIDERGCLSLNDYQKLLNPKTKIVAVSHIANSTGTLNDIHLIIQLAHEIGAKVLIDGAQAASHLKLDVTALNADFYLFSGHKIYGPTGIGILYGKKELLEAMPPYQGGGDMIEKVTLERSSYNKLPLKFEAGTPAIAEVIGLGAAINYLEKVGLKAIAQWEKKLLNYAMTKLEQVKGLRFIGSSPERGPILSFIIDGAHPLDLATLLDLQGIEIRSGHLCAQPTMCRFGISAACRASFAFYNTLQEIDYFVHHLQRATALLHK